MYKINYTIKRTSASTDYLEIEEKDLHVIQMSIIGILTYMTELSISKNKNVKDFTNWFTTSDNRYHYNTKLKKHNSPQSFLSGCINNLHFGQQNDMTLVQLNTVQDIINTCIDIIDALYDETNINLQSNRMFTKIWATENLWSIK